jgi:translation initiation factor 3 subunit L
VLNYLHALIRSSRIEEYLKDISNPSGKMGFAFTDENVRLLGYFSLMQLLRMHSLLGDYHLAMKTIEHIDFHTEVPLFYQIPAVHVTLYYYMGFAYLMLRRYVDAINTFSNILAFLSKTTGVNSLSYQCEAMRKKEEQMYVLLLLGHALCPRPLDEAIERVIRDKFIEKQARLQRGEELCFEDSFIYACPKFVSAAPPDYDNTENFNANEAHARQAKLFLQEVKQQQFLPKIGAYMKLYTAITTSKLAALCEMDEEALRDQLMCVMHKTRQRVRRSGSPLDGDIQSCNEVEFYLDGDMVHINAQREERPHSEVFLEHILKYQDLLKKMGKGATSGETAKLEDGEKA